MRKLYEYIVVRGWLVAESPLHVGGLTSDPEIDLTLARDGLDRYTVPGTSLAGALRAWMEVAESETHVVADVAAMVWGSQEQASALSVEDGLVFSSLTEAQQASDGGTLRDPFIDPNAGGRVETRTGVGISRVHGAAVPKVLFSRSVLGKGVAVRLEVRLEIPDAAHAPSMRAYLNCLLTELVQGHVQLGAARTGGLGHVRLDADTATVEHVQMTSREGVLRRLRQGTSGVPFIGFSWETAGAIFSRPGAVRVTIPWTQLLPVMVLDSIEGIAVDQLPLTSAVPATAGALERRPVIPGTSIKGVLRAHAERIVRTKFSVPTPAGDSTSTQQFAEMLDQMRLVTALFGRAGSNEEQAPIGREHHGRAALSAHDVVGHARIEESDWDVLLEGEGGTKDTRARQPSSSVRGEHARLSEALLHRLAAQGLAPRTRNALDRWTGGTVDGALFSVLEPRDARWSDIVLELDIRRLSSDERAPALALLMYVLRDFCAGMIPIGHASTSGYGSATADEVDVTVTGLDAAAGLLGATALPDSISLYDLRRSRSPWMVGASSAFNSWSEGELTTESPMEPEER